MINIDIGKVIYW